jgi:xanthine dehydrogenase YagS FAD-binding subunit
MKEFGYVRPADAAEAVATTYADANARYLGGGTNLVDLMKLGVETPSLLVDIAGLPLGQIEATDDAGLRIGALASNTDIAVDRLVRDGFPLLSEALLSGASGQLRNTATAGGNLLQRTRCGYFTDISKPCNKRQPGAGCAAKEGEHRNHAILGASTHCVATHPSDFAVALAALDARVEVESPAGTRTLALSDFYLPVGDTPQHEVALEHGELITAILVPAPPDAARSRYRKVRERASYAFAIGSVAAVVVVDDGTIRDVRIAIGAVASMPWRARLAEAALSDVAPSAASFAAAADLELAHARPLRDNTYKVPLVRDLIVATLCELTGVPT